MNDTSNNALENTQSCMQVRRHCNLSEWAGRYSGVEIPKFGLAHTSNQRVVCCDVYSLSSVGLQSDSELV